MRLCKLHGSINWFKEPGLGVRRIFSTPLDVSVNDLVDAGEILEHSREPPELLAGSYNKLNRYYENPYAYMFRYWEAILNETSMVAVSGYGFGDLAVNLSLFNWMHTDPSRQLHIFHKYPDDLKRKARHWDALSAGIWANQGRLRYTTNWIGELTADQIVDKLAQSNT